MSAPRPLHIFVLIDAMGWAIIKQLDFLSGMLPYRTPLRTVLGFSSGAIPTILTGVPPARTGHWNLLYYDPKGSPFRWLRLFGWLPAAVLNNRYGRKLLKELGRRVLGLGSSFECLVSPRLLPYFNWAEKRNIYARGGIASGNSIIDELTAAEVAHRVYSYHGGSDAEILRQASEDVRAGEVSVFFLYLCELDHFLHDHRSDPDRIERKLRWYEQELSALHKLASGIDPGLTFSVFSDHGMAPVRQHYDLVRDVESLGFSMPGDYLAVYDSTMARFWFFRDAARQAVTTVLEAATCGRILPDAELRAHGVFFEDRRFGELVFLLDAGCMMLRSDFNGPRWNPKGMHGYHPDDADSDAVFLANKPPDTAMAGIADVHRHMRSCIGLGSQA